MRWLHKILASIQWRAPRFSVADYHYLQEHIHSLDDLRFCHLYLPKAKPYEFLQQPDWWKTHLKGLIWLKNSSAHISLCGESDYPKGLLEAHCPPPMISYWGKPCWVDQVCVSVIGSRHLTDVGRRWIETELGVTMSQRPSLVWVSGGARGVDQQVHRTALLHGAPTVVFLPSGLQQLYPRAIGSILPYVISGGGAVVSQFGPFQPMLKHHFLIRNEMIAAISPLTLMVEGRRRSGSLMTAKYAIDLGRSVGTLPVTPDHPAQANNDLINDGAIMVRQSQDLLATLG